MWWGSCRTWIVPTSRSWAPTMAFGSLGAWSPRYHERLAEGSPRDAPSDRGRIPADCPQTGTPAQSHRARPLLGDVVRALQLQELSHAPEAASHQGEARLAGTGRERGRGRSGLRPGGSFQDRVPQPPLIHRTLPRCAHRGGGHHPGHLYHGGAAGGPPELPTLWSALRSPEPPSARGRGGGGRVLLVKAR